MPLIVPEGYDDKMSLDNLPDNALNHHTVPGDYDDITCANVSTRTFTTITNPALYHTVLPHTTRTKPKAHGNTQSGAVTQKRGHTNTCTGQPGVATLV